MAQPGPEIRRAREGRGLSLRTLAERAGLSHGYLSRAENGHLVPVWNTLVRIAEVLDCEPHLRLLPSESSIASRVQELARMSPQQRLAGHEVEPEDALHALVESGIAFVVTGAVAGVLHGLPMTIERMTVVVRDEPDSYVQLVDLLMRARALFREVEPDDLRAMCAETTWPIGWCDVKFEFVEELPPATKVTVGSIAVDVLPLPSLVAEDRDAADVFDLVRARLAG